MLPVVTAGEGKEVVKLEADLYLGGTVIPFDATKNSFPNIDGLLKADCWVGERNVDAGLESFVNNSDPVSREEKNA